MFIAIICGIIFILLLRKYWRDQKTEIKDQQIKGTLFHIRGGKSVEVDEVNRAWVSGNLKRMLDAVNIDTNPIDRHFLLLSIVIETYKNRREPRMREICKKIGYLHISEFDKIAPILKKEIGVDGILPSVPTFKNLATVLTEDQEFDKAIDVCMKAITFGVLDGTVSGFEGRISRIKKKRQLVENV